MLLINTRIKRVATWMTQNHASCRNATAAAAKDIWSKPRQWFFTRLPPQSMYEYNENIKTAIQQFSQLKMPLTACI